MNRTIVQFAIKTRTFQAWLIVGIRDKACSLCNEMFVITTCSVAGTHADVMVFQTRQFV